MTEKENKVEESIGLDRLDIDNGRKEGVKENSVYNSSLDFFTEM